MGRPRPSRLSVPMLLLLLVLGGRAGLGAAFYLPGLAPVSFCEPSDTKQEGPAAGCSVGRRAGWDGMMGGSGVSS